MLPLVFHVFALYHLYVGLKNKERLHSFYGGMSLLLLAFTGWIGVLVLPNVPEIVLRAFR
jgi:hypothetical protein